MWESGYHPWEASSDLGYFANRHELEWKDQVYCDISFSEIDEQTRLIRCECVNHTPFEQNLVLHYMSSMNFPQVSSHSEAIEMCRVELPDGALWIDALDYDELKYAVARPTDNLVPDGFLRGEARGHGFTNGTGIGTGFGRNSGDWAAYSIRLDKPLENARLLLRYRMQDGLRTVIELQGLGLHSERLTLTGTGEFEEISIAVGDISAAAHEFKLIAGGPEPLELDGFVLSAEDRLSAVRFHPVVWNPVPDVLPGPKPNSMILKYEQADRYYGIHWGWDDYEVRQFYCHELDRFMRHTVHHHVYSTFRDEGNGHFTNAFLRPIFLPARTSKVIYGVVCVADTRSEAEDRIAKFEGKPESSEPYYLAARGKTADMTAIPAGDAYTFSQRLLAAAILTNVVYPIYTKRSYIKHHTPGRWWDCLYTWDQGFVGIGLAELDLDRAIDSLNAYMTEPGDPHAAFIHHGSPVPVQHYLFLELWNRTQSRELLEYFYPRLRQYYLFISGSHGSSTTRALKSNLIKTWDYFYNSGGWDDYPPQVHVHSNKLSNSVAPVSNTSHCIRIAKILSMAAEALGGLQEDIQGYEADIAMFSSAIQQHAWDEESGYFGYVRHDEEGQPIAILRHESGENFNRGMDGTYPLVAGICTPEQQERLIGHLMSEQEMWSPIGISTVDRSAAYYSQDGYWNGAVWMPHQWFYWKTLLDLGRPELARRIARTALDLWKREAETTYNCYEHFIVQSGRGAGWHQFGGLSAPVLSWFNAYYKPGRLTCGFDAWIKKMEFSTDRTSLNAVLNCRSPQGSSYSVIAVMNPGYAYEATWNGESVAVPSMAEGCLELTLVNRQEDGELIIRKL